jgi:hypothetical protein
MICNLLLLLAAAAGPAVELKEIVILGALDKEAVPLRQGRGDLSHPVQVEVHSPKALIGVEHIR